VERPPKTIEYICLSCGAQGSIHTEAEDGDPNKKGGSLLRCPRCKGSVLYLERKAADDLSELLPVEN
jgi:DNA-directed RNA polymerase subunit RPC12/RpoP